MTTVESEHAFKVHCRGKSSRQLYFTACEEQDMRPNSALLTTLPPKMDFYGMQHMELDGGNYIGARGCFALMDVIRANTSLIVLRMRNQGADDEVVAKLVEALRGHQRLETLDLRDNFDITNASAPQLFTLLTENQMIHELLLDGTSVGKGVQRALTNKGRDNALLEANFFRGDYAKLKKLFVELDSDGSGTITVGELLAQIDVPQVAQALEKRFEAVAQRGDGSFGMDEFLFYIHPKFVPLDGLKRHMDENMVTDPEPTIVANWNTLRECLVKGRMEFQAFQHVRVTHKVLSEAEMMKLLEAAMEEEWKSGRERQMNAQGRLALHHSAFVAAIQKLYGEEEKEAVKVRRETWGKLHLSPILVKDLHKRYVEAVFSSSRRPAHLISDPELIEMELGHPALSSKCESQTVRIQPKILKQRLLAAHIGSSITVTFPEWITFINEQYEAAAYFIYNPDGVARPQSSGGSETTPIEDSSSRRSSYSAAAVGNNINAATQTS